MSRVNFAKLVLSIMERDDLTEEELAKKCGVRQSTINRLKRGATDVPGYELGARLVRLWEAK